MNDPNHCGNCDTQCKPDEYCAKGKCESIASCPQDKCEGWCGDFKTDQNHCGNCETKCGADQYCSDGTCQKLDTCTQDKCEGWCGDFKTDNAHCGNCETKCDPDAYCDGGTCKKIETCEQDKCDGWCGDFKTDNAHCGNCETKCGNGEKCSKGQCINATECSEQQYKCFCNAQNSGNCTKEETPKYDVLCIAPTAPSTCGATDCEHFGKQCKPGYLCVDGECECPETLVLNPDSGECLDPKSEKSCGVTLAQLAEGTLTQCGTNEYCDGSICRCKSGYARENDNSPCFDILSDNNNCGELNHPCQSNSSCINGQCVCDKGFVACGVQCLEPLSDRCCGFEVDENSRTPFEICDGILERCKPVEGSKHVYECVCYYSDENGNCIDLESNNNYCGDDKENCENIIGGAFCLNGKCKCNNDNARIKTNKDGQKVCAEISRDPNCCGDECEKCDADQVCESRRCKNQCEYSENINCNGHCLDKEVYHVEEDENNPGHCKCSINLNTNRQMCPDVNNDPNYGCSVAYKRDNNNCSECGDKCNNNKVCFSDGICRCGTLNGVLHHECTFPANSYNNNESAITTCMPATYFSENHVMIPTEGDCSKCEENYANLDGDWSNGCEVDLKTTMKHCGAANNDCHVQINQAYEVSCQEGKCEFQGCSNTNFMDCNDDSTRDDPDGCETNILTSATHCGKCGHACTEGAICHEGACCYQAYNDIQADIAQFQCCEGYHLYEYKPSFAFPFCWGAARYACSATDMSESDGCWVAVE